ncbi:MAG: DNA recombination protein RmuC [Planctomycetota bacterium]
MEPLTITLGLVALATTVFALLSFRRALVAESACQLAEARLADQRTAKEAFETLAGESLRSAQRELVESSRAVLDSQRQAGKSELDARRSAIDALIKPLGEALERTSRQIEKQTQRNDTLEGLIAAVRQGQGALHSETQQLSQALRRPNVRGRYGEVQLERVVELAGMRSYCDFDAQSQLGADNPTGDGVQRPDMVVHLPNGRSVVIDAKVPIDSYLDATTADGEAEESRFLALYGKAVLYQVRKLGKKEYWRHFDPAPEFVVMFLPGDQFVDAALRAEPALIDEAAKSNVLLASPSSLIGLLRAIHVGWRERSLTESAEELFEEGRLLHDRASRVLEHAADLGVHLERTRKSYNRFVGSIESRLLPTLRKFEEKGAKSEKKLVVPKILVEPTRTFRDALEVDATLALPSGQAHGDDEDDAAEPQQHPALPDLGDDEHRDAERD